MTRRFFSCLSALALSLGFASPVLAQSKGQAAGEVIFTQRTIEIQGGIALASMKKAQSELLEFASQGDEPVWIRINSPGGSVDAGLILIDTMKGVKAPIYCVVESSAYSMGAMILSFCDKRYGLKHATFMLHEASYGASGEDPHNRSKMEFLTRFLDKVHEEVARNLKMDPKAYRNRIRDTWWMQAEEAKAAGLIDEIITKINYNRIPSSKAETKQTLSYTQVSAPDKVVQPAPSKAPTIPKRKD